MYLSNENFTCPKDNAQRTQISPYFADTMRKVLKHSMKPETNAIENSVDPDQLASDQDPHCFYTTWHYKFIINL